MGANRKTLATVLVRGQLSNQLTNLHALGCIGGDNADVWAASVDARDATLVYGHGLIDGDACLWFVDRTDTNDITDGVAGKGNPVSGNLLCGLVRTNILRLSLAMVACHKLGSVLVLLGCKGILIMFVVGGEHSASLEEFRWELLQRTPLAVVLIKICNPLGSTMHHAFGKWSHKLSSEWVHELTTGALILNCGLADAKGLVLAIVSRTDDDLGVDGELDPANVCLIFARSLIDMNDYGTEPLAIENLPGDDKGADHDLSLVKDTPDNFCNTAL